MCIVESSLNPTTTAVRFSTRLTLKRHGQTLEEGDRQEPNGVVFHVAPLVSAPAPYTRFLDSLKLPIGTKSPAPEGVHPPN